MPLEGKNKTLLLEGAMGAGTGEVNEITPAVVKLTKPSLPQLSTEKRG